MARRKRDEITRRGADTLWIYHLREARDAVHAENAYNKLKTGQNPKSATARGALWIADVEQRIQQMAGDEEAF